MFLIACSSRAEAQSLRPAQTVSDQPKLRLYPNPAVSYIQVDWSAQIKPASILIINGVTGKQMITGTIGSGPLRLNLSDYVPGIYVLRLFSSTGTYLGGSTFQVSK